MQSCWHDGTRLLLIGDHLAVLDDHAVVEGFVVLDGDTTRCHVEDLGRTRCQRIIGSNGAAYLIVFDRLAAVRAHRYEWNLQAASAPTIDTTRVRYVAGLAGMDPWSLAPQAPRRTSSVTTVRAISTTQEPEHFHEAVLNTLTIENAEPAAS